MKLDRSQPFGEIFGGTGQARYEQDGRQFNLDGDEVAAAPTSSEDTDTVAEPEVPARKRRGSKTSG